MSNHKLFKFRTFLLTNVATCLFANEKHVIDTVVKKTHFLHFSRLVLGYIQVTHRDFLFPAHVFLLFGVTWTAEAGTTGF
jgi:hypothetical protein